MHCTIHGEPVGKQRPRLFVRNGNILAYTPEKTRKWERDAAKMFSNAWAPKDPIEGPVYLRVVAVKERPKSLLARHCPDGRIIRTTRPDIDNVAKAVADALQKARVFHDDSQIAVMILLSAYGARGETPRIEVEVRGVLDSDPMP